MTWWRVAMRELAGRRPAATHPAALLAAGCAAATALADSPSLQAMIDEFGKPAVVFVLLERRGGRITVRTDEGIKEAWGRPRLELVDSTTLAADAKKAGLGLAELRAALESHTRESRELERRLGGATELKARVAEFAAERGELPTSWADLRLDDAESAVWCRRLGLALADRGTIVVHLRWRCASRDFRNIARFMHQCTYRPASGG